MTLRGAIFQLKELRDNRMMPVMFKPYFDKVIETVSECEEPSAQQEPCEDAVSRQAAIDAMNGLPKWPDAVSGVCLDYADVIAVLSEHLPSAQPERKTGRWLEREDYEGSYYYDCSVCGNSWTTIDGTPQENGMNYCPNCGAEMKGGTV